MENDAQQILNHDADREFLRQCGAAWFEPVHDKSISNRSQRVGKVDQFESQELIRLAVNSGLAASQVLEDLDQEML